MLEMQQLTTERLSLEVEREDSPNWLVLVSNERFDIQRDHVISQIQRVTSPYADKLNFGHVDILDESAYSWLAKMMVLMTPTFYIFKRGKPIKHIFGMIPDETLTDVIEELCKPGLQERAQEIIEAIQRGETPQ